MNRIKHSLITISGISLPRFALLVGLLAMFWLCAAAALSQSHHGAPPPTTGTLERPPAADQSFRAPQSWAQELTREQGWGPEYPRMLADVNGDKRQDVVGFGIHGVWLATSKVRSIPSTGATLDVFSPKFVLADFGYQSGWRAQKHVRTTGDINGDQREDVVGFGNAGVYRALATVPSVRGRRVRLPGVRDDGGFAAVAFVVPDFGYDQGWRVDRHVRLLADVSGDGKKDIVAFGNDGVWLSLATSDGYFSAPALVILDFGYNQGWRPEKHIRTTADVNGDGRQDIVGFGDHGVWIALSTGGGFGPAQFVLADLSLYAGGWRVDRHPRLLADINGDGKQDIVGFGNDGVWIALSTGSGFEAPQFVLADFGYNQGWREGRPPRFVDGVAQTGCTDSTCPELGIHPRFVADLNGDGYQDIVGFGHASVYRALGGPGGFGPVRGMLRALVVEQGHPWLHYPDVVPNWYPRLVGDVTGDGKQDLVAFDQSDIKVVPSSDLPPPPPPAVPSNPRVTGKTKTSLTVAWNDNSGDERYFFINYFKAGSGPRQRVRVGAGVTTAVLGSLASDTDYGFTVQAESLFGVSAESRLEFGRTDPEQQQPPPPPPPQGFSSVNVFNCHSERRPVHVWTRDVTQSTWVQRGTVSAQWDSSGSCPGSAAPFTVPLQDGRSFWFVVVDPQLIGCGGQNNPESSACQRSVFTSPLKGNANGPALRHLVN